MASRDDPIVISSSPESSPVKDQTSIDRDRSATKALLDTQLSDDDADTTDRSQFAAYARHDQQSGFDSSSSPAVVEQNLFVASSFGEIQPSSSQKHVDGLPLMPATNVGMTGSLKTASLGDFANKLPYTGAAFGRPSLPGAYLPGNTSSLQDGPIFGSSRSHPATTPFSFSASSRNTDTNINAAHGRDNQQKSGSNLHEDRYAAAGVPFQQTSGAGLVCKVNGRSQSPRAYTQTPIQGPVRIESAVDFQSSPAKPSQKPVPQLPPADTVSQTAFGTIGDAKRLKPKQKHSVHESQISVDLEHDILVLAQKMLEESLFEFAQHRMPKVTADQGWSSPVQGELSAWSSVLNKHSSRFTSALKLVNSFSNPDHFKKLLRELHQLRHVAVHRSQIGTIGLKMFLPYTLNFTRALQDMPRHDKFGAIEWGIWKPENANLTRILAMSPDEFASFGIPERHHFVNQAEISEPWTIPSTLRHKAAILFPVDRHAHLLGLAQVVLPTVPAKRARSRSQSPERHVKRQHVRARSPPTDSPVPSGKRQKPRKRDVDAQHGLKAHASADSKPQERVTIDLTSDIEEEKSNRSEVQSLRLSKSNAIDQAGSMHTGTVILANRIIDLTEDD